MEAEQEQIKEKAKKIFEVLNEVHPDARVLLNYKSPFELLVATILAAQCTDERVNRVTPSLFSEYPDPRGMAQADMEKLQQLIKSTGFFKNKARSLKEMSTALVEKFNGEVPKTMEKMVKLPGVGRKTASVVLGNCFGVPAIIVDTHVRRVAERLGLSDSKEPDKIEQDLCKLFPPHKWTRFSYLLNFHGRYTCAAKKPKCRECRIKQLCPYPAKTE